MFPAAFDYERPATLDEALGLLAKHGDASKVMAGGQSLIPLLKLRFAQPGVLVDIGRIQGLAGGGHHNRAINPAAPAVRAARGRALDSRPTGPKPGNDRRLDLPCRPTRRLGLANARARRR